MRRALLELSRKIDFKNLESVSIDWNDNYDFEILPIKPIFEIKWDERILEIWAASIIAKVFRDKLVSQYALLYPDLWIERHKWYWTKEHIKYLKDRTKVVGIHRVSYRPVKEILNSGSILSPLNPPPRVRIKKIWLSKKII
jgi:ribonuclease HII